MLRSYQVRLSSSVADPSCTTRLPDRSSGSGNFLFHAATMLSEIERFEPITAEAAKAAVAGQTRDLDFIRLAAEPFGARADEID